MEFKEIENKKLKRKYEFVLTASDLDKEVNQKLEQERPNIEMKGFRKGKVPSSLLKQMHGESILSDVMKNRTDEYVKNHFETSGNKPAYEPKIELINKNWKKGDDINLSIEYEAMPKIPKVELDKITLEKIISEPDKKTIDESMENIRAGALDYKDGKDSDKAKSKDQVTLDFEGFIDGKAFENGAGSDFPLVLGSNSFIPGFEDQLIGVKKGQETTVKVKFPEEYGSKDLAGKDAEFKCKIKKIANPVKPEINDDLAKKFGVESLKQLKENLDKQVRSEFEQASKTLLKKSLMDKLESDLKFELPQTLVETEAFNIASHARNSSNEKQEAEKIVPTKEEVKVAERRVRVGLFFAEIGVENKLDLNDSEMQAAFAQEAKRYPGQEQEYLKFIQSNPQAQQAVRAPLFEEKIVEHILKSVEIKEKKISVAKFKDEINKINGSD
jgi:trigger factor